MILPQTIGGLHRANETLVEMEERHHNGETFTFHDALVYASALNVISALDYLNKSVDRFETYRTKPH